MAKSKLHNIDVKISLMVSDDYYSKHHSGLTITDTDILDSLKVKSSLPGIKLFNIELLNEES